MKISRPWGSAFPRWPCRRSWAAGARNWSQDAAVELGGRFENARGVDEEGVAFRLQAHGGDQPVEEAGVDGGPQEPVPAVLGQPLHGDDDVGEFPEAEKDVADVDALDPWSG